MAVQPKKRKPKSKHATKKNTSSKKSTSTLRKRKRRKKSYLKRNILIAVALLLVVACVGFGFYLGQKTETLPIAIEHAEAEERGDVEGEYTTKQLLEDLAKIKAHHVQEKVALETKKVEPVKKKVTPPKKPSIQNVVLATRAKRPKLAIVIDDVSHQRQLDAIRSTKLPITPSIFPPSELSMSSHKLARGLKHYMIHLPMESGSKQFNSQYKTLLRYFPAKRIENRVKELRRLFPNARYINNHTGSVYTKDYVAMKRLYHALRKEGFVFVDSRTIGSSKVRKIAHDYGDAYVARDIFIDNKHSISYIHKQLRKAVKKAKKKGYAVAIGHPHKITMQALKSAHDIFKDVELVYIDSLYVRGGKQ